MNRIDVTTLLDGPKHAIIHVFLQSDGSSGDIDSYDLTQNITGKPYAIDNVTWSFAGFYAKLHFELLTQDTLIWVLPEYAYFQDFMMYGGLKDRGNPLDASGKLFLSTTNFTDGAEGSLVLRVRKDA